MILIWLISGHSVYIHLKEETLFGASHAAHMLL